MVAALKAAGGRRDLGREFVPEPSSMVNSETGGEADAPIRTRCAWKRERRIPGRSPVEIFRAAGRAGRQGPLGEGPPVFLSPGVHVRHDEPLQHPLRRLLLLRRAKQFARENGDPEAWRELMRREKARASPMSFLPGQNLRSFPNCWLFVSPRCAGLHRDNGVRSIDPPSLPDAHLRLGNDGTSFRVRKARAFSAARIANYRATPAPSSSILSQE